MTIIDAFFNGDTIYISGPITPNDSCKDQAQNLQLFHVIEHSLIEQYNGRITVHNPANLDQQLDYDEMMRRDFHVLNECSHILMLPGWQYSRGACSELLIANQMNLKVRYLISDNVTVVKSLIDCTAVKRTMLETLESAIGSL